MIAGVCGGLAEYFDVDVTLIRLLAVVLAFIQGIGILFYILCWIIIPLKPLSSGEEEVKVEESSEKSKANLVLGIIFIFLGFLLLLNYTFSFEFLRFWPVVLIFLGIIFLIMGGKNEKR